MVYTSISDNTYAAGSFKFATIANYNMADCLAGCLARAVCKVHCVASSTTPTNGGKGTCGSLVSDGSTCTQTCNLGFTAGVTSATRTCTKGTLSASTLMCTASSCPASTTTPTNGGKGSCISSVSSGSSCTETCNAGYTAGGTSATRTCTQGTLSASTLSCSATALLTCQWPTANAGKSISYKAGCNCDSTTMDCADFCDSTDAINFGSCGAHSASSGGCAYMLFTSVGDSISAAGYKFNQIPNYSVAQCLMGCQARSICKVHCTASTTTPTNGGKGTCGSLINDGSTCTETCNSGYTAGGSATRACSKGTLSGSTINCGSGGSGGNTPSSPTTTSTPTPGGSAAACSSKVFCSSCIDYRDRTPANNQVVVGCMWCPNKYTKCVDTNNSTFPLNNATTAIAKYNSICGTSISAVNYTDSHFSSAQGYCQAGATAIQPSTMLFGLTVVLVSLLHTSI
eukprot:gb/GEZN01006638.1/.p1 GENE.gb/GEZN01006638.1/~~gb/GEZN01006638.1/.p1  ORF type:complete len:533 (+),score=29.40 gb/GEZN01006638.1/:233-1600(+)